MEVSPTWDQPWPPSELQAVPLCPICECPERTILRDRLVDNVCWGFRAGVHWRRCGMETPSDDVHHYF